MYKWRKKRGSGAHIFFWNGKRYRTVPGEVVVCPIDVLGSFYTEYDCIAEVIDGKEQPIKNDPVLKHERLEQEAISQPSGLKVVHKGFGRYYVINPDNPDSPLNDKAMSKEEAEKFLAYCNEDI